MQTQLLTLLFQARPFLAAEITFVGPHGEGRDGKTNGNISSQKGLPAADSSGWLIPKIGTLVLFGKIPVPKKGMRNLFWRTRLVSDLSWIRTKYCSHVM